MARKSAGSKRKAKVEITPRDYRFPGESGVYWTAVAALFIGSVWIVGMFLVFAKTKAGLPQWQWIYLFLWPILAVWLANFMSTRGRLTELKRIGRQAKVMASNHPELYNMLVQYSQVLGMKKVPDLYLVDDKQAFIYAIPGRPGAIIASKALLNGLTTQEFGALVARELGSLAAHNVRVGLAITWMQTANPLFKLLCLPLFLMTLMMRGWMDLTEFTADRAAVLATGNVPLVNLALARFVILRDPQADVNQDDLEAYLHGSADISSDSAQLERHFKIGKFFEAQPNLRERIQQIREYPTTDQGRAAFEKRAQIKTG